LVIHALGGGRPEFDAFSTGDDLVMARWLPLLYAPRADAVIETLERRWPPPNRIKRFSSCTIRSSADLPRGADCARARCLIARTLPVKNSKSQISLRKNKSVGAMSAAARGRLGTRRGLLMRWGCTSFKIVVAGSFRAGVGEAYAIAAPAREILVRPSIRSPARRLLAAASPRASLFGERRALPTLADSCCAFWTPGRCCI